MERYKICPNCNWQNPPDEIICIKCMADIINVPVTGDSAVREAKKTEGIERKESFKKESYDDRTMVEVSKIVLRGNNFVLEVFSGDVVGRHEKGKEYLEVYKTVSRRHARFFKQAGTWYVEDLNSTNGVYINGRRIKGKDVIKKGDRISLSLSLELTVDELQ
ncbi:FHA domain-containing protein [Anaerocellum diazotrophicum]|uniref:FHA domain-containing protein n=1 Tax=Caldicellulosiruptor diazotrophicus TaxID=2806205 RepID=A0ABM7NQJ4_9FIRM|nr:FHA domain-containing protein [Caldicellulosiruptor diazotrophicus]BCS82415.1 hypothetical protein CaldiYA01_23750 [Caldicellulosiruptor diazotrophicus]